MKTFSDAEQLPRCSTRRWTLNMKVGFFSLFFFLVFSWRKICYLLRAVTGLPSLSGYLGTLLLGATLCAWRGMLLTLQCFLGKVRALHSYNLLVSMGRISRSSWCWCSLCYLLRRGTQTGSKARELPVRFPTHSPVLSFSYFCGGLGISEFLPPSTRKTSVGQILSCHPDCAFMASHHVSM